MKYIIQIVLVFLLLNVSVKALSLKEAVNDSLSNNLSLKIEAINVDMAEEDYLQSTCLLYTSPSPRDLSTSRMPSSA